MNREQFLEWKENKVTQAVMLAVVNRVELAKEELVASDNPAYDQFVRGMIRAFREVLDVNLDDVQEEKSE